MPSLQTKENIGPNEIIKSCQELFDNRLNAYIKDGLIPPQFELNDAIEELGFENATILATAVALARNDLYLCAGLVEQVNRARTLDMSKEFLHWLSTNVRQDYFRKGLEYANRLEKYEIMNIPIRLRQLLEEIVEKFNMAEVKEDRAHTETNSPPLVNETAKQKRDSYIQMSGDVLKPGDVQNLLSRALVVGNSSIIDDILARRKSFDNVYGSGEKFLYIAWKEACAMLKSYRGMLKLFIENSVIVDLTDGKGFTPLSMAAEIGDVKLLKQLVAKGANINHKSREGFSPLFLAVRKSQRATALTLKALGATLNSRDILNAAKEGDVNVMKVLMEMDVDINLKDPWGSTPLHWAVIRRNEVVVNLLLESGADVNVKDQDNWSPLHFAAENGHLPSVELLVAKGTDINARTSWGGTPLKLAISRSHSRVADYLRSNGADD